MLVQNNFIKKYIKNKFQRTNIWFVFLLLFLMVPILAVTIIKNHGPKMEMQTFNNLSSIAELKAYQIQSWLNEQDKVAHVVSSNKVLMDNVQKLLNKRGNVAYKDNISELLGALKEFYGYESVELISPERETLVRLGKSHNLSNPALKLMIEKSVKYHSVERSDIVFHNESASDIAVITPLSDSVNGVKHVLALVVTYSNLSEQIFPYIRRWPTTSASSESILVREVAGKVEYFSPLRFGNDSAHPLNNYSVRNKDLVSAVALRKGTIGIVTGVDYRGVKVMASYRPIKGTKWMVVSKIDATEAVASLHDLILLISLVSLIALVFIALAFWIVLNNQKDLDRYRLLSERTESERVLQQFYELPFIGMAILNSDASHWARFNERFRVMLGYSEDELKNMTFFDLLPYSEQELFKQRFADLASQQKDGFTQETRLVGSDQELVYVIASIQCTRRTSGDVKQYLLTVQDTTELKQLGERYIEYQNHLNLLINTIPDLIWLKDVNGIYLSCNPRFESLFGAKEKDIVGKTDYDFVDVEVADFFRAHDVNAMEADVPTENEEWLTFAENGYKGLFSTVKTPMKDKRGNVIGVLGVARDITKRKEDQAKLERLTKIYSALSQTNEAIIQCSSEEELYNKVCEITVKYAEMKMAWVGSLDEQSGKVIPIAREGVNSAYLQGLEISIDEDSPTGQGPTAIAMRSNSPYWCQDFQKDPHTMHWHERASKYGWRSSASIPLVKKSKVVGALNMYSDVVNAFDTGVQNLLLEMAADISFALTSYEAEQVRESIEFQRKEALERLQKIAGRLPGMIYQFQLFPDGRSCFPFSSEAMESIYHLKPEEVVEDARAIFDVVHPDDLEMVNLSIQESAENLSPWKQEFRVVFDDNEVRWLSANAIPQREDDGSVLWYGFTTDITESKKTEEQIQLASKVFEQSREGIMITDSDLNLLMVNDAFTDITGYEREEVLGKSPSLLSSGKHPKEFYLQMWEQIEKEGYWQGEIWNRHKSGKFYPEWLSISQGKNSFGEVSQYIGVFTDISRLKESEEQIHRLVHFDSLTSLANRETLVKRLKQNITSAEQSHNQVALLFIDLDHFKNINDTLGHYVGDQLLMEVGHRIAELLSPDYLLARQGGDEFIVAMPNANENEVAHLAESILKSVSSEMLLENLNLQITPSIGISIFPQDGTDADSLLKNADTAMYQAKRDGRNTYRFFAAEMQENAAQIMSVESALRTALVRNEFELYYQPQISVETNTVIGAEALIRWNNPGLGRVSPAEFIPIAEQSGQILEIGNWVLQTAVEQIKEWKDKELPIVNIAVNLSAAQFRDESLPNQIIELLSQNKVDPSYLTVELTETLAMSNPYSAVQIMDQLTSHGIKIAIDDFGTGYSSLNYLKKFKATKLKLDQSFVQDVVDDLDDRSIIEGMISLARSLGLKTIAEGVETKEQLAFLTEKGCDEIQGFYFSKPLPADEFGQFISNYKS
ncbi:EAL domain-containing protein [Hydrogenovibrio kuenenii]|uniref:EAL domain-containing protein n=1 Tax=Hydrogenovibrio kuenenii TaxID=63658 RepID=UPI0004655183|nr:EAL domain-containing protein [Hydrogenovibrio kuenenii]